MSKVLVEIEQLYVGYDRRPVLKEVSLQIFEQDYLGVIGPNGGGKTTLVKTILGLLKPLSGTIRLGNGLNKQIGYMPQINQIDQKFPILVSEVVASGLNSKSAGKDKQVAAVLERMGLTDLAKRPIGELSGGQLQRTLLGRAIVNNPRLLILDEPSSYVDKYFEIHFYDLLREINQTAAIVLVSHDIGTVVSNVKNIACVNETLHYHPGADISNHWLEVHFSCPFEVVGHGDIPHRILKKHD